MSDEKEKLNEVIIKIQRKKRKQKDCWCMSGEGCGCAVDDYNEALDDVLQVLTNNL
jgi:hypothetical protein